MIIRIKGLLYFSYSCPKIKDNLIKVKLLSSLLVILAGIFLLPQIGYLSSITTEKLIELTNQERNNAGINSLTANQLLTKAAMEKSQSILDSQTFKHNIGDEKFSSWIKRAGYEYSYVGENLAIDFVTSEGIIKAWRDSPLHKNNLLNPNFKEIGVAVTNGNFQGENTTLVVQIFGAPPRTSTPPQVVKNYNNLSLLKNFSNSLNPDLKLYPLSGSENLLIHSALNQSFLPANFNKYTINNLDSDYKLNNFFERLNSSSPFYDFVIIFITLVSIISIFYLYYLYFLRLSKVINP